MEYIRRVSYQMNGNTMIFSHGQEVAGRFRITKIKETFEGSNHFVDIMVSPLDRNVSAKWKRIINGTSIIEYNVEFLCLNQDQ